MYTSTPTAIMVKMVPRRGWLRLSFLGLLAACGLVYVYYYSSAAPNPQLLKDKPQGEPGRAGPGERRMERHSDLENGQGQAIPSAQCHAIPAPKTDVNTVDQFPKFEFQVSCIHIVHRFQLQQVRYSIKYSIIKFADLNSRQVIFIIFISLTSK